MKNGNINININDIVLHPKFGTGKVTNTSYGRLDSKDVKLIQISFPRRVMKFVEHIAIKNGLDVMDINVNCNIRKWRKLHKESNKIIENTLKKQLNL